MKKFSALPLIGTIVLSIALLIGVYYILKPAQEVKAFTEEDAKKAAENLYNGEVLDVNKQEKFFIVEMGLENGVYDIVFTEEGKVRSVTQTEVIEKNPSENILTEAEIKEIINNDSTGKITNIKLDEKHQNLIYQATVEEENQTISYQIDAKTGKIISKDSTTNVANNENKPEKEEPKDHTNEEATAKLLTEKQAKEIALKHLKGEVENINLHSSGHSSYYLVKIDTDDDDAIVQVHAVTGEILSISWLDDDDDDDDGDDDDDDD